MRSLLLAAGVAVALSTGACYGPVKEAVALYADAIVDHTAVDGALVSACENESDPAKKKQACDAARHGFQIIGDQATELKKKLTQ